MNLMFVICRDLHAHSMAPVTTDPAFLPRTVSRGTAICGRWWFDFGEPGYGGSRTNHHVQRHTVCDPAVNEVAGLCPDCHSYAGAGDRRQCGSIQRSECVDLAAGELAERRKSVYAAARLRSGKHSVAVLS